MLVCSVILQATSLINIMKSLSESIVHHIKYYVQLGQDDVKGKSVKPLQHTLPIHRMTVINLATFLVQFLESLVPLEKVRKLSYCYPVLSGKETDLKIKYYN